MKFRLVILTLVLSIAPFLLNSTIASARDTESQGGCFPGTYLVVEGSGHSKPLDIVTGWRISSYKLR
jgi:hypothetical protein